MRKFLSFIVMMCLTVSLLAVPANRRPFVVKQSDGTMLSVVQNGDEALHFIMTLDGKYVVREENGDFCYAVFSKESGFTSTGVLAHNEGERSIEEMDFLSSMDFEVMKSDVIEAHRECSEKYRSSVPTRAASSGPITTGEIKVAVLLVEFKDLKFTFDKKDIEMVLNEPGYKYENPWFKSYGSARDYFIAQSGGLFTPEFVVTDIVTLKNNLAYYGENSTSERGSDGRPREMIREALLLADENTDFSQFDNNDDGKADFIYCIYAGYAESNAEPGTKTELIWPHQWQLSSRSTSSQIVDGVEFDKYACSSELNDCEAYEDYYGGKWLAGIGTICHEFSHCLGLHDVYDVDGNSGNWGMDEWDLMANGNYVAYGYIPPGYNSFQKDVCGWKKLEVLEKKGVYTMKPQSQGGVGYKIVNDANPNEYFILENRKREGWDQKIAADGMMIIHVDYDVNAWNSNKINVTPGHPRFQIVPADNELLPYGEKLFYENMAGDLWPGIARNTEFTNTSFPAAKVYTGEFLDKPVTKIKYENDIVSFSFLGGVSVPEVMPATDISENSFVANWTAVEDAVGYMVELYKVVNATDGSGDRVALVNENFIKCTQVNTSIQNNMDNYMSVKGWKGSNVFSENGMLRLGTSSNAGYLSTPILNASGNIAVVLNASLGNGYDKNVELTVELLDASSKVIESKVFSSLGNVELECAVNGEFRVRFSSSKRILLDDVAVSEILSIRKEYVTVAETKNNYYKFNELVSGKYVYRVKANATDAESLFTDYVEVVLAGETVINDAVANNGVVEVFSVNGLKVYSGNIDAMPKLQRGIYIVKGWAGTSKLYID